MKPHLHHLVQRERERKGKDRQREGNKKSGGRLGWGGTNFCSMPKAFHIWGSHLSTSPCHLLLSIKKSRRMSGMRKKSLRLSNSADVVRTELTDHRKKKWQKGRIGKTEREDSKKQVLIGFPWLLIHYNLKGNIHVIVQCCLFTSKRKHELHWRLLAFVEQLPTQCNLGGVNLHSFIFGSHFLIVHKSVMCTPIQSNCYGSLTINYHARWDF